MGSKVTWFVYDEESDPPKRLAEFPTEEEAVSWVGEQDPEKVFRGGFGIGNNGPEE